VTPTLPPVPVMVLNWNGWDDTLRCLASLRSDPDVSEVWLVDNGSAVDRSAEATLAYPGLRVLRWSENFGFAGGYNRALAEAAREGYALAYLLNNDCEIRPGFLKNAVRVLREDDGLAAVGSCIVQADPPHHVIFDGVYGSATAGPLEPFGLRSGRDVNGAGMLLRLRAAEEAGYFDERFFCYGEETHLCWRMVDRGWRIATCGSSVVLHRRQGSDLNRNALYYQTRNALLLLERLGPLRRRAWKARLVTRAAANAYGALRAGARASGLAIAAAMVDGLRGRFGKRTAAVSDLGLRALLAWGWLAWRVVRHSGKRVLPEPPGSAPL
jgi:GT2 family glycosyltransferase